MNPADTADIVTYATSTVGVNANLQTGVAIAGAQVDNLMLVAPGNNTFERVYGSAQADNLTGDDQPNRLRPSKGDDVVTGGANVGGFDLIDYFDLSDAVRRTWLRDPRRAPLQATIPSRVSKAFVARAVRTPSPTTQR